MNECLNAHTAPLATIFLFRWLRMRIGSNIFVSLDIYIFTFFKLKLRINVLFGKFKNINGDSCN